MLSWSWSARFFNTSLDVFDIGVEAARRGLDVMYCVFEHGVTEGLRTAELNL